VTDIVIVNRCTVLSDAQIQAVIPALQAQVSEEWSREWPGRGATLHFTGYLSSAVPSGMWPLYILDTTDVPGAGGYHQNVGGLPEGKVFAADAMHYGEAWTVDVSHELLEMLADPYVNTIVRLPHSNWHCFQEVCDAVEADQYGYHKLSRWPDILLSDFCLPAYFTGQGTKFDVMGHLTSPAPHLLPGGYLGIELANGQWVQITARETDGSVGRRARRHGRTGRRLASGQ
jgi:hypothetical protein